MIMVEVGNEASANLPAALLQMNEGRYGFGVPEIITLWMKTWGDDVESRCEKHMWLKLCPVAINPGKKLEGGGAFNDHLLQQKMNKTGMFGNISCSPLL